MTGDSRLLASDQDWRRGRIARSLRAHEYVVTTQISITAR